MGNRNLKIEKEQALKLYLKGFTSPVMISRIINLPRQTVAAWIRREQWELKRENEGSTPLELAQEFTSLLKQMLREVKEKKDAGESVSMQTLKEMLMMTRAVRQLDEDYDIRGSVLQFANKFINFVSALPVEVLPIEERKPFVAALQKTMPLFLKSLSEG